jgi:hypothetical protein
MKYNPSSNYIFECNIASSGIQAAEVEKKIKECLHSIIKENSPHKALLSNECSDKKMRMSKILSILEETQSLVDGKIVHIGRLPEHWKEELKTEMEEKQELDAKKLLFLDDCIILCVEKDAEIKAVVINRKAIYSISSNTPT